MENTKRLDVVVEARCWEEKHGALPPTFRAAADVSTSVASYGFNAGSSMHRFAAVTVEVPEWVSESETYSGAIGKTGFKGNAGTGDLCFVVCAKTAEREAAFYGQIDAREMLDEAIASGMVLIHPNAQGEMERLSVPVVEVRYMGFPKEEF